MRGLTLQLILIFILLQGSSISLIACRYINHFYSIEQNNLKNEIKTLNDDSTVVSRITPGEPSTYDWIKLLDGKEIEVEIRKISEKFVYFSKPGDMETDYIDRRQVQTIYYRTGKIEPMSANPTEIRKIIEWEQVDITNNPKDVEGMIKIEELKVALQATTRHHYYKPETLETSAEIILRKNAGLNGGEIVLVTSREHHRAYGDPPRVTLLGTSYRKR